ncbi:MAG: ATP-binding protein, partial [Bacteroidales bacterium]|nr:ATP-binding protein [Bacteroidales bacterium]
KANKINQVPASKFPNRLLLDITRDTDTSFWVSGYGSEKGGICKLIVQPEYFNQFDERFITVEQYTHYHSKTGENMLPQVKGALKVNDTLLYITGKDIGLCEVTLKNGIPVNYHFNHISKDTKKLWGSANHTSVLLLDKDRGLWIGTRGGGVLLFDTDTKKIKDYRKNKQDSTAISGRSVSSILKSKNGEIWIGTYGGGLNRYVDSTDSFIHFTIKSGLPSNKIYSMLEDTANGAIWLSTDMGLCRFDMLNHTTKNFNHYDGLQGLSFTDNASERLSDGRFVMGGSNGLNIFNPDIEKRYCKVKAQPLFTNLIVNYNSVKFSEDNSEDNILRKSIWNTDTIYLKPHQNNFTIEFASMSFTRPDKNKYKFKLVNYNDKWVETNAKSPYASFSNLTGGKYLFRLKVSNADGVWNDEYKELAVFIQSYIYQKLWFQLLVVLISVLLVLIVYYLRIKNIQHQKEVLEQLVKKRTLEIGEKNSELEAQADQLMDYTKILEDRQLTIEEQSEELSVQNEKLLEVIATKDKLFSIIAHDLKNPFNSILGLTQLLDTRYYKFEDDKKHHLIQQINNSANIIFRLLENLLQWSRSQTGNISFAPERVLLRKVIDEIIDISSSAAGKKNIKIQKSFDDAIEVYADYNMINTVFRNLVSNAIKFTMDGTIKFEADLKEKGTMVTVSDTGIGMSSDIKRNLF